MNKSRLYLYILYLLVAMGIVALASCASDDLVADGAQKGGRMSLGINVQQITEGTKMRVSAPAIKTYQMKNSTGKPVYAQFSSEAYIGKHDAPIFYTQPSKGGGLLFVPCLGYNSSTIRYTQGGYLMSGGVSSTTCWLFYYTSSAVYSYYNAKRCIGRPIWPTAD